MMRYKLLGNSGLRVSEMALGTMTFGEDWGWGADKATSGLIFDAFVAAGGNFIDTSNNYTNGTSERFVGEFIAEARDQFVVATKYTLRLDGGNPRNFNEGGNSRKSMMRSVENSLHRLGTDYIDLLYLHMWDFMTPVEEVMRGLDDLVRAGKVLYVGFSDSPSWVVAYAVGLAERYGWARPVAAQVPYNFADRDAERDILPMARTFGLTVTAWGLLSGGAFTGKYNDDSNGNAPKRYDGASEKEKRIAADLRTVAAEVSRSPSQVAVNWVRHQPGVIPILGARTLAQIEDNLGALDFTLSAEQLARLSALNEFRPGFPLSFLTSDHVRGLIFGETFAQIDHPRSVV
jgi:aryl-alcohol dehydrogenase-like predicted oxidoreductase